MNILVTGGAGFIGSHTCVALLGAGYGVIVADNLSNSSAETLERVKQITRQRGSLLPDRCDRGGGGGEGFCRASSRRGDSLCRA